MADKTIRTHVVFPKELVESVDRLVGPRKRSRFFVQAIEEKIERERLGRALATTAGFLPEGIPSGMGNTGAGFGLGA